MKFPVPFKSTALSATHGIRLLFVACQQMEIGTKPIPISVLTAVTNSALNAASVFPSRRIEISDSHTDLNRSADIPILRFMDAALQDFEVSAGRAWHVKVGKLVRCARRPMTDQHFAAVLLHLRILIVLLGFVVSILVAFAWEYLWRETKPASRVIAGNIERHWFRLICPSRSGISIMRAD